MLKRFRLEPIPEARSIGRFLWENYVVWPTPAWRARGRAKATILGRKFTFATRGLDAPMTFLRAVKQGNWELDLLSRIPRLLSNCVSVCDIGAWIGPYSIIFGTLLGPEGRVYALEPDPVARARLESNVRLNKLNNVTVLPFAVSDQNSVERFSTPLLGGSGSHLGLRPNDALTIETRCVRLDDLCRTIEVWPDLIKVDVEGGEQKVLTGGKEAISRAKCVVVEFHPSAFSDPTLALTEIARTLQDSGKTIVRLPETGGVSPTVPEEAIPFHLLATAPRANSRL